MRQAAGSPVCMWSNQVHGTDVCRHRLPPGAQPCHGAFITGTSLGMRGYRHGKHTAIRVHTVRPTHGPQGCRTEGRARVRLYCPKPPASVRSLPPPPGALADGKSLAWCRLCRLPLGVVEALLLGAWVRRADSPPPLSAAAPEGPATGLPARDGIAAPCRQLALLQRCALIQTARIAMHSNMHCLLPPVHRALHRSLTLYVYMIYIIYSERGGSNAQAADP